MIFLSIEIGKLLTWIPKHKNLIIIATQCPNKGFYMRKRQDLDTKFLSRFQMIYFSKFSYEELIKIVKGLNERFHYIK